MENGPDWREILIPDGHGIAEYQINRANQQPNTGRSDVDLLVEFEPDRIPGLFRLASMERELESLIGRPVDLRTYHDLSKFFRDNVTATAQILYAA